MAGMGYSSLGQGVHSLVRQPNHALDGIATLGTGKNGPIATYRTPADIPKQAAAYSPSSAVPPEHEHVVASELRVLRNMDGYTMAVAGLVLLGAILWMRRG